jgi:hypothetical protein
MTLEQIRDDIFNYFMSSLIREENNYLLSKAPSINKIYVHKLTIDKGLISFCELRIFNLSRSGNWDNYSIKIVDSITQRTINSIDFSINSSN